MTLIDCPHDWCGLDPVGRVFAAFMKLAAWVILLPRTVKYSVKAHTEPRIAPGFDAAFRYGETFESRSNYLNKYMTKAMCSPVVCASVAALCRVVPPPPALSDA